MSSVNPGKAINRAFTVPASVQHKIEAINPGKALAAAAEPVVSATKAALKPITNLLNPSIPTIEVPSANASNIQVGVDAAAAAAAQAALRDRTRAINATSADAARSRLAAGALGGGTGFSLGALGRTGRGAVGYSSLLGR